LLARVRRGEVAGVIIMGENVNTVAQLHAAGEALREAASDGGLPAPLIMVDQEGGDVKRFRTAAPESSAASLGSGSISAARAAGRSTGNDLRNRGTNIDLAPVVDIARGSDNFLGSRVFGATNAKVTSRACAFAAGLRESRVVATLKHFPGLGGASGTNTDIAPVSIDGSSAQISKAWDPYRKCALNSGTMVMLSNATYPDAFGSRPASVNPKVYRALREDLGFKGVAITDSLAAGSLASVPHPAAAAVEAGADLALFVGEEESKGAFRDLKSAYRTGELSRERLAEAVARVRSLRKLVGDVQ
jgi:beta-N-acetylhexosaminidase